MRSETIKNRLDAAELKRKELDIENERQKSTNETGRLAMDKVNILRLLLAESWVGGKGENLNYSPLLTDEETKTVKKKLFQLIDQL